MLSDNNKTVKCKKLGHQMNYDSCPKNGTVLILTVQSYVQKDVDEMASSVGSDQTVPLEAV